MSQSDIINSRQIQWFPGHMTKTLRLMEKEIRNVDCVLQILDARIPLSSLNPEIERITAGKPHLYVLNKSDLADPEITKQWLAYFKSAGAGCIAMDSKQRGRATVTKGLIEKELSALMERRRSRGMVGAAIRVMIVGIPNVGKSTFINSFAGTTRAKAANKPGVTRGKQWISVDSFDLMDMPGVLWKKFDSLETASNLVTLNRWFWHGADGRKLLQLQSVCVILFIMNKCVKLPKRGRAHGTKTGRRRTDRLTKQ